MSVKNCHVCQTRLHIICYSENIHRTFILLIVPVYFVNNWTRHHRIRGPIWMLFSKFQRRENMKSSADCGHAHQFILSFMCLFKYSVSLTKLNYVLFLGICTVAKKMHTCAYVLIVKCSYIFDCQQGGSFLQKYTNKKKTDKNICIYVLIIKRSYIFDCSSRVVRSYKNTRCTCVMQQLLG